MSQQVELLAGIDIQALKLTLDQLVRNAGMLLGVPSVSVALLDAETGDLVTWAALGTGPEGLRHTRFRHNEGIAGWVAAHLEPVIVNDVTHDARFKQLGEPRIRSMLCVPLIDDDQLLGTLTVASPLKADFDERRQKLLQVFSDQAVLAISKTRQAEAAKAQARELSALLDATRALTSSLEPNQVFAYIVGSTRKVITCDDVVIYAYDERTDSLRIVTGTGSRIERLGGARVPLSDGRSIAAWVAKHRRARISSPGVDTIGSVTEAFLAGDDLSLLCVPLVSKGRLRGVIMLARETPFQPGELGAMLNLSNIVAATLENADLYQTTRAEREQQAAIYSAASDAIAVVDNDLAIIEANDAFANLVGVPRSQIYGQSCCGVMRAHPEGKCSICVGGCLLQRAMDSGDAVPHIECELPPRHAEASGSTSRPRKANYRYIDFSVTPVNSPQGRRLLLVGRDVTAAREMDHMKANFLSMVSHELRSPLQTISGYLDLALSGLGGDLEPKQAEFVRRARAGSEHMTALVDDLLLVSRRDAGEFTLNRHETNLAAVVGDVGQELELLAQVAGVRLEIDLPEEPVMLRVDGPRIGQVVRNLMTNALKFTPEGGVVTLSLETRDDEALVHVRDTGIGIATEHVGKIFDRFFQVSAPGPNARAQGQGLGLAIVRIIVEGHGGMITVETAPRQGSTFTVRLPRVTPGATVASA